MPTIRKVDEHGNEIIISFDIIKLNFPFMIESIQDGTPHLVPYNIDMGYKNMKEYDEELLESLK